MGFFIKIRPRNPSPNDIENNTVLYEKSFCILIKPIKSIRTKLSARHLKRIVFLFGMNDSMTALSNPIDVYKSFLTLSKRCDNIVQSQIERK